MVTEDYVSFETAKLLKEKGFNEPCLMCYTYCETLENYGNYNSYKNSDVFSFTAPTIQMTMKWLREVHHYYIQVMLDSWACGEHLGYYVVIQKTDSDFEMMLQDALDEVFYSSYEQACEAAIKYCLENLI